MCPTNMAADVMTKNLSKTHNHGEKLRPTFEGLKNVLLSSSFEKTPPLYTPKHS
jgi:hypothetical protein